MIENSFTCVICNKQYKGESGAKYHFVHTHLCQPELNTYDPIGKYYEENNEEMCSSCGEEFPKCFLRSHFICNHVDPENLLKCDFCDYECWVDEAMDAHLKYDHFLGQDGRFYSFFSRRESLLFIFKKTNTKNHILDLIVEISCETEEKLKSIFEKIPEHSRVFLKKDDFKFKGNQYPGYMISTTNADYYLGAVTKTKSHCFESLLFSIAKYFKILICLSIGDFGRGKSSSAIEIADPASYSFVLIRRLVCGRIIKINNIYIRVNPEFATEVREQFPWYLGGNSRNIGVQFETGLSSLNALHFQFSKDKKQWDDGIEPTFQSFLNSIQEVCFIGTPKGPDRDGVLNIIGKLDAMELATGEVKANWKVIQTDEILKRTSSLLLKELRDSPDMPIEKIRTDKLERINLLLKGPGKGHSQKVKQTLQEQIRWVLNKKEILESLNLNPQDISFICEL